MDFENVFNAEKERKERDVLETYKKFIPDIEDKLNEMLNYLLEKNGLSKEGILSNQPTISDYDEYLTYKVDEDTSNKYMDFLKELGHKPTMDDVNAFISNNNITVNKEELKSNQKNFEVQNALSPIMTETKVWLNKKLKELNSYDNYWWE